MNAMRRNRAHEPHPAYWSVEIWGRVGARLYPAGMEVCRPLARVGCLPRSPGPLARDPRELPPRPPILPGMVRPHRPRADPGRRDPPPDEGVEQRLRSRSCAPSTIGLRFESLSAFATWACRPRWWSTRTRWPYQPRSRRPRLGPASRRRCARGPFASRQVPR